MNQTANILVSHDQITDVVQFFDEITASYLSFECNILKLIKKIPQYTPQQISAECNKIAVQRKKLAIMDQQMIDIIELAGNEIALSPMVHHYRLAFAGANMACINLYQKLLALRASLQDEQIPAYSF